jgi:hypothetical protein
VLRGSMEPEAAPAARALATVRQVDSQGPAQLQGLLRRTALLATLVGTEQQAGPIPNAQVLVLLVGTRRLASPPVHTLHLQRLDQPESTIDAGTALVASKLNNCSPMSTTSTTHLMWKRSTNCSRRRTTYVTTVALKWTRTFGLQKTATTSSKSLVMTTFIYGSALTPTQPWLPARSPQFLDGLAAANGTNMGLSSPPRKHSVPAASTSCVPSPTKELQVTILLLGSLAWQTCRRSRLSPQTAPLCLLRT